jgi:hypothetical protein
MAIVTIGTAGIFLFDVFECKPIEFQWDYTIQSGTCVSGDSLVNAAYAFSILSVLRLALGPPSHSHALVCKNEPTNESRCHRHPFSRRICFRCDTYPHQVPFRPRSCRRHPLRQHKHHDLDNRRARSRHNCCIRCDVTPLRACKIPGFSSTNTSEAYANARDARPSARGGGNSMPTLEAGSPYGQGQELDMNDMLKHSRVLANGSQDFILQQTESPSRLATSAKSQV